MTGASEVDSRPARRSERAGAIGLALLLVAMAFAAWASADAIPGRSNGGSLVEAADGLAALPCAIAALYATLLVRGKTDVTSAAGWFVVACVLLLLVFFMAAVSNSGLGS